MNSSLIYAMSMTLCDASPLKYSISHLGFVIECARGRKNVPGDIFLQM